MRANGNRSITRMASLPILVVSNFFHPVDDFAIEAFLDRDVRHRVFVRRAVPMFQTRREPNDIAGTDFLDGPAFALNPAEAESDDQCLAQRVRVPGGSGAGFERDARGSRSRWLFWLKQRINPQIAGEPVCRTFR